MNTKWYFLIVLVLLATLVGGGASAAQAQGGITGISPEEGTVGTQVTITGAGFGDKHGEVLLGDEKSKVLAWSDTEITFLLDKPQPVGKYTVAILLQGDKQSAEQLTFTEFKMRRPWISQEDTGLILYGNSLTILGQFFGDKKGEVGVAYLQGEEIVIENTKVVDWSMNSIRCELPDGLTGKFILIVSNEVGKGFALWDHGEGLLGYPPPPPGWIGELEEDGATGIVYNGRLYVFSIHAWEENLSDYNYRVQVRTFDPNTGEFSNYYKIPKAESYAIPSPVVVEDKLWVFHTGQNRDVIGTDGKIYYTTYTPGVWTAWQPIPDAVLPEKLMVSPVYDKRNHRLSVYYRNKDSYLTWIYTDDFGASWSKPEQVGGKLKDFSHAIYWPTATTTALAATDNGVFALNNGEYRGYIMSDGLSTYRPYLVDLGSGIALLYGKSTSWDTYPYIRMFNYYSWSWDDPYQVVNPPELNPFYGHYEFDQAPRGSLYVVKNASGVDERHLYIFYNTGLDGWYAEPPLYYDWYIYDSGVVPPPLVTPTPKATVFKQVTAGEYHACAINSDDKVDCWGNNDDGQLNHPAGTFTQVSAATWHTCGVKTDGTIACWGEEDGGRISGAPTTNGFTQVSVGNWHGCGLKTNGSVDCWGIQDDGRTNDKAGPFKQITSGNWHNCGVRKDNNHVECWGKEDSGRISGAPTTDTFTQVSAGNWHSCGVRTNGTIVCWGDNDKNRVSPVPTLVAGLTYKEVSAGSWHTCALVSDGSIRCWGCDDDNRVSSTPTTGIFTHIEAGIRNTCATRQDGGITCWGINNDQQSNPPF